MNERLKWLQREWAARLGPAVESMAGEQARAESIDGVSGPVEPGTIVLRQPTGLAPDACLWVLAPQATWAAIGSKVLDSAGLEDAGAEETRSTFLEVIQQSLSPLEQAIGARVKSEVAFGPSGLEQSPETGLEWARIKVTMGRVEHPPLEISMTPAMYDALNAPSGQPAPGQQPCQAATRQGAPEAAPIRGSKTMDLLLEVELPVGVSFGRVQMKLRDAVKLTTGSIVELNRRVTEPVEVIVNNCVIARGEVVVVEGNYGVRIQEIVSREERLRTLF